MSEQPDGWDTWLYPHIPPTRSTTTRALAVGVSKGHRTATGTLRRKATSVRKEVNRAILGAVPVTLAQRADYGH